MKNPVNRVSVGNDLYALVGKAAAIKKLTPSEVVRIALEHYFANIGTIEEHELNQLKDLVKERKIRSVRTRQKGSGARFTGKQIVDGCWLELSGELNQEKQEEQHETKLG